MKDLVYCPYLGEKIPKENLSIEHIIPKSLGGHDKFTIHVDRETNSKLGSFIDGAVANDPILGMKRVRSVSFKGSAKTFNWKNGRTESGAPFQLVFDQSTLKFFDPIAGHVVNSLPTGTEQITSKFKIDPYIRMPFSAKVALGTGHYLFGEEFRKNALHNELRIALKPIHEVEQSVLRKNKVLYTDYLFDKNNDKHKQSHRVHEAVIKHFGGASVLVDIDRKHMIFTIGLFGEWFSTISVPITKDRFPYDGEYGLGHFVVISGGSFSQISYREALHKVATEQFGINLPSLDKIQDGSVKLRSKSIVCQKCGYKEQLTGWKVKILLDKRTEFKESIRLIPCPQCGATTRELSE
ncbi:MAG: hypothetical protein CMM78_02645 [Rhodospirillaceae bacterium]|jgi:hypothetical protein|uniref:HNH endonuclease n=1 Tax=Hwanghaeella sp. 1Z406 TaxID=3402811 RepID=UPI000C3C112F|nr:hypothetical protein [Rhodospirillales bacterium]MAX47084.1 hypothetical protein [Rhodospirillaceae bacterium]|tara:strand:+ start:1148 stop:2203 length:1056 start_codon:yes stop_codon:yes gene_type:complete